MLATGLAAGTLSGCGGHHSGRLSGTPGELFDLTSFTSYGQFIGTQLGGANFVAHQSTVEFNFNVQAVLAGGCAWVFSLVVGTNGGQPDDPMVVGIVSGLTGGQMLAPNVKVHTPTAIRGEVLGSFGHEEGIRTTSGQYVLDGLQPGSTYTAQIVASVISYADFIELPASVTEVNYLDQASDQRTIIVCTGGSQLYAVTSSWKPRWSDGVYQDRSPLPPGESATRMYSYSLNRLPAGSRAEDVYCSRTSLFALVTNWSAGTASAISALTTTVTDCTFTTGETKVLTSGAAGSMVGSAVTGPGISAGTVVVGAIANSALTLSTPVTATGSDMTLVVRPTVQGTTNPVAGGAKTVMCCIDDSRVGAGVVGWVTASNGRLYPVNLATHQIDSQGIPVGAGTDFLGGVAFTKSGGAATSRMWVCNTSASTVNPIQLADVASLTGALSTTGPLDTLPCTSLGQDLAAGSYVYVQSTFQGIQIFSVSAPVNAGATDIPVVAQVPAYAFQARSVITAITPGTPVSLPTRWTPWRIKASGDATMWVGSATKAELIQLSATGQVVRTWNADVANDAKAGTYGAIRDIAISEAATPQYPHGGAGLFWFSTNNAGGIDCTTLDQWYPPPEGLVGGTGGVSHDGYDYIFWVDNATTPRRVGEWLGGEFTFNQDSSEVGSATLILLGGSPA